MGITNGAILIISTVLKYIMSSAAEAEIGAVFLNAKKVTILRTTLEELGHPQPPTPLQTDNTTSTGEKQWDNQTKRHTSYGYALLFGNRQGKTRAICRLFYKTPFAGAS
jgi:hypothetical protein